MSNKMKKHFLTLTVGLMLTAATTLAQTTATDKIYIDTGNKGHDIPSSMYGIFFEEINHAGDGGLYAELIQNRAFEEHVIPSGSTYQDGKVYFPYSLNYYGMDMTQEVDNWDLESKKMQAWSVTGTGCTVSYDVKEMAEPLDSVTPHALELTISNSTASGKAIVQNAGYWGVPSVKNATYKVRFYLRTADYTGNVRAYIYDNQTKKDLGGEDFTVTTNGEWTEYTAIITASQTQDDDGVFRLEFSGNGTVDIDYVSLFPTDTYKGRENGIRRDLAEILEGMHPAFMRWPGGCIVEGITLENRVKWKETIDSDPMKRRGEYVLWGYRSTWGLGYHEFLQFCEDMGMAGMFVDNAGLSCCLRNGDFTVNEDSVELFYQDMRDAIEYAIGDPLTNEWAAMRAARGHYEPFPLKYVEIGNENGTARYIHNFNYIYQKLKADYPQITFINTLTQDIYDIVGNGTETEYTNGDKVRATDMVDPHWYVDPDYFFNNVDIFDSSKVTRGKYTVYVGEYATNNGVGQGTLEAALSESAFMMNMERNSDLVKMASYAPLITNVNQPNWACNLIWQKNGQVMGRASYYLQKMFAENRPDYNVNSQLYSNLLSQPFQGRIGVGTWLTSAKFRNVKVSSVDGDTIYYESDFTNKENEWSPIYGTWSVSNGTYNQTSTSETGAVSIMNTRSFPSGVIEVEAMKTGGAEGFLIDFACASGDLSSHYRLNLGGWGNTKAAIEKCSDKGGSVVSDMVNYTLKNNQWYAIKVVVNGNKVTCYVDGTQILSYATSTRLPGRLQSISGYDSTNGEIVVKVVNGTRKAWTPELSLNAQDIAGTATAITLTSAGREDENSMDNQTLITPQETTVSNISNTFSYTFPAYSFTILRIKASPADAAIEIPTFNYTTEPLDLTNLDEVVTYTVENSATKWTTYTLQPAISTKDSLLIGYYGLVSNDAQGILYFHSGQDSYKGLIEERFNAENAFRCKFRYIAAKKAYSIETTYGDGTAYTQGIGGGHYINTAPGGIVFMGSCAATQYGTDAQDHALWYVTYDADHKGFLIESKGREGYYLNYDADASHVYTSSTKYYWRLRPITSASYDPTGIADIHTDEQAASDDLAYYTLDGIAHQLPVRGINIHQGKKMIVK